MEKDLAIRKRFEEAAAMELQKGWDRGTKKTSFELQREAEETAKENDIQEVLRNRPGGPVDDIELRDTRQKNRTSADIHELLRRGFGSVRRESAGINTE